MSLAVGATDNVFIRGKRNGGWLSQTIKVHMYHAVLDAEVSEIAAKYKWGMRFDIKDTYPDPNNVAKIPNDLVIAVGDEVIWTAFPGQEFPISEPQTSRGAFVVTTAYFMDVGK